MNKAIKLMLAAIALFGLSNSNALERFEQREKNLKEYQALLKIQNKTPQQQARQDELLRLLRDFNKKRFPRETYSHPQSGE